MAVVIATLMLDGWSGWPDGPLRGIYAPIVILAVVVGWVLASRRPDNVIGPLFLVLGLAFGFYLPVDLLANRPDPPDVVRVAAVLTNATDAPMFILIAWILLHFPDGELPSGRWRWTVRLGAIAIATCMVAILIRPGPVMAFPRLDNPIGIAHPAAEVAALAGQSFGYGTMLVLLVAAVAAVVRRFRRGGPVVRAQVKWVAAASLVLLIAEVGNVLTFDPADPYGQPYWVIAATIGFALIPIAIGIAVLRYRLYEIDRLVSRTIGWAIVTGLLVAVFGAGLLGLQGLLAGVTQGQTLAVAASTLVAFALFQPLRRLVQRMVDRRFDRSRYDGQRVAATFAEELRQEVDLGRVSAGLVAAAHSTVRPATASIWLRGGRG